MTRYVFDIIDTFVIQDDYVDEDVDHAYDVTVELDEDYGGDVNDDVDHVYDVIVDTMETLPLVEMSTIRYLT